MAKVQCLLFVLDESAQCAAPRTGMSVRARRSKLAVCGSMHLCWADGRTKTCMFDSKLLKEWIWILAFQTKHGQQVSCRMRNWNAWMRRRRMISLCHGPEVIQYSIINTENSRQNFIYRNSDQHMVCVMESSIHDRLKAITPLCCILYWLPDSPGIRIK